MRRTQFITAIVVAAVTFFSLQAFVGQRYQGPFGGWYGGRHWHRPHGYYDPYYNAPPSYYDRRYDWRYGPPPLQPVNPADTLARPNY